MPNRNDVGNDLTEKKLAALEKRISSVYSQAEKDMEGKIKAYFESFAARDAEQKKMLDAGEITAEQYRQWRLAQIGRGKRYEALRDKLAERMTQANATAASYINDSTPGIYALNRNYTAYTIEQVAGNVGFDLWDEQTVKRQLVLQPDDMPYYPPERAVQRGFDLAFGKRQISAQTTSGILQGETIKQLSDRLQKNIPDMNRVSAVRAARTATTAAQNAGRMDCFHSAQKRGIQIEKEWVSTLDDRTRHTHAMLDGKVVPIDTPFEVDGFRIMFPGDPSADPSMVYNCRCTMISRIKGVDMSDAQRRDRNGLGPDMTYQEWEQMKGGGA